MSCVEGNRPKRGATTLAEESAEEYAPGVLRKLAKTLVPRPVRRTIHAARQFTGVLYAAWQGNGTPEYTPDFSLLESYDIQGVTDQIVQAIDALPVPKNAAYFQNMNRYHFQHLLLRWFYPDAWKLLQTTRLYPPNLFVLEYFSRHQAKTFVDLPAGYGNIFGYVRKIQPSTQCFGVDNFSQIEREIVEKFQRTTFKVSVCSVEELDGRTIDVLSVVGLPLNWVAGDVLRVNPKVLLVERRYAGRPELPRGWRVVGQNRVVIYLERE